MPPYHAEQAFGLENRADNRRVNAADSVGGHARGISGRGDEHLSRRGMACRSLSNKRCELKCVCQDFNTVQHVLRSQVEDSIGSFGAAKYHIHDSLLPLKVRYNTEEGGGTRG